MAAADDAQQQPVIAKQVRQHWGLLNHEAYGCTEVVLLDRDRRRKPVVGFFDDMELLVTALEPHAAKNIYVNANPRPAGWADNKFTKRKRGTESEVETLCSIVLDIDPADRKKGTIGSEADHQAALVIAGQIAKQHSGAVVDSGGGAQVWLPVIPAAVGDLGGVVKFKAQVKAWRQQVAAEHGLADRGLEIDPTQDLVHIYRLAGAFNHKPPEKPGDPPRPCRIISTSAEPADVALAEILAISVADSDEQEPSTPSFSTTELPDRLDDFLTNSEQFQDLWEQPAPDGDQSGRDFALACLCLENGFSPEETAAIIWQMPHGKRRRDNRRADYVQDTVARAAGKVQVQGATATEPQADEPEHAPAAAPEADIPVEDALPTEGWLHDWIDYCGETTEAPTQYHLAVGLAVLAATVGRRCWLPWGDGKLFPNLYLALIGAQGRPRKSTAVSMGRDVLDRCFPSEHIPVLDKKGKPTGEMKLELGALIPWDASVEGLVGGLKSSPTGIMTPGELSQLLAIMGRSYNLGMAQLVADLYDAPPRYTRLLKKEFILIEDAAPSIVGASTLAWLTQQTDEIALQGGLLSRFAYFFAFRAGELKPFRPIADKRKANKLTKRVHELRDVLQKDPRALSWEAGAEMAYRTFYYQVMTDQPEGPLAGFLSRLAVTAIKCAMLYELAADPTSHAISPTAWDRAQGLATYLQEGARRFVTGATGDEYAKQREKVLAIIRAAPGIARSTLMKNTHLSAKQLDEALQTLGQSALVRGTTKKGRKGPDATTYFPY